MDVSPNCDCHFENDAPIVPDIGMFASFDPVALDVACVDAVNSQPVSQAAIFQNHIITLMTTSPGFIRIPTGEHPSITLSRSGSGAKIMN